MAVTPGVRSPLSDAGCQWKIASALCEQAKDGVGHVD
jgi:hypothetical protein